MVEDRNVRGARTATCIFDAPPAGGLVVASAVDRDGRHVMASTVDRCVEIRSTAHSYCRVHPPHWFSPTQVDRAGRDVRSLVASCPVDAPDDDGGCCCLDWFFPTTAATPTEHRLTSYSLAEPSPYLARRVNIITS